MVAYFTRLSLLRLLFLFMFFFTKYILFMAQKEFFRSCAIKGPDGLRMKL